MNPIRRRPDGNGRRATSAASAPKSPKKRTSAHKKAPVRRTPKPHAAISTPQATTQPSNLPGIRLNKYLADQGIASRREADVLIETKKILINGKIAKIGARVLPTDTVQLAGETKAKRYIAYYKGRGIITHSPAEREIDIATRLQKDYGITDVTPVGRLDKDSEGLIILSNDGRITGPLLDPESAHEKEYSVTVDKNVTPAFCKLMELGVMIEGYRTKPAQVVASTKNQKRFNLIITEGKKHQIRRMCAALGYQVASLKRVRIMNIELGALKPNQYRKISGTELSDFLRQLDI